MSRAIFEAPTMVPLASRTGEIVTDTSINLPSLVARIVSKWSTRSPRRRRSRIIGSSSSRSGGNRVSMLLPTISSAL
jgi:hypothetical protein